MPDLNEAACPDPPELDWMLPSFEGVIGFDIGANVGQSMQIMASRFQKVVSVEPALESLEVLRRRALLHLNVVVLGAACSAEDGIVTLTVQRDHIARGQLTTHDPDVVLPEDVAHGWGDVLGQRSVPAVTVDTLAEWHGTPSMIKVDVEGHEVQVVKGAKKTIEHHCPDWLIEVHNAALGEEIADLLRPTYGSAEIVRHPHYAPGTWGHENHYWMLVRG